MNILKIQQDILKSIAKGNGLYKFSVDNKNVAIIHDSEIAYIIPREKFYINIESLDMKMSDMINERICPWNYKDYEPAKLTPQLLALSYLPGNDWLVRKIAGETHHVWAKFSYIKQFGPFATFAINGKRDPIQVFENGNYVGLIMPVKVFMEGWDNGAT